MILAKWQRELVVTMAGMGLTLGLAACTGGGGSGGIGGNGNNSLITSIERIDEKDRARAGIRYVLECDGDKTLEAKQVNGTQILFDGTRLVDGQDKCAMLVFADVVPEENLIWTDLQKTAGLYYGSDKQTVQNRKLTLTLFKTYKEPTSGPTFTLKLNVKFNLPEGAAMPAEGKTTAVLECGGESVNEVTYDDLENDSKASLTFVNNSIEKLKDKTCTELTILEQGEAQNPVATYEAKGLAIALTDAQGDETLTFPKEDGQYYTLERKDEGGDDDVGVDLLEGKCFLPYDSAATECPDVRESAAFPYDKSYVFAEVKGKADAGDGAEKTYLVSFGDGVRFASSETLDLVALNKALKEATEDAKAPYSFWKTSATAKLLDATLRADQVDGSALAADRVEQNEAKNTLFMHITKVWVHGFKATAEADLNAQDQAHWFGIVTAQKEGETDQRFVVTGSDGFFFSAEKAAADGEKFFDFADMITNLKELGSDEKWSLYTYKGGPLERSGCDVEVEFYAAGLSQKNADTLTDLEKEVASCAHNRLTVIDSNIDETWESSSNYYRLGWYRLEK